MLVTLLSVDRWEAHGRYVDSGNVTVDVGSAAAVDKVMELEVNMRRTGAVRYRYRVDAEQSHDGTSSRLRCHRTLCRRHHAQPLCLVLSYTDGYCPAI